MAKTIAEELAEKTYKELGYDPKTGTYTQQPNASPISSYPSPSSSYHMKQPKAPFRIPALEKTKFQSPTGTTYRYSALYRNAIVLQLMVEKWTGGLDPREHHRLITQVNDAARSVVANIAEGYARPTTKEYLEYLGFSKASLEEITTDIIHSKDIGLLSSKPGSSLESIGIFLKPMPPFNTTSSTPASFFDPLGDLKRKIGGVKREDVTFEIYMELINKTNYLFKRTVEGLWNKLTTDEREKLREKIKAIWAGW